MRVSSLRTPVSVRCAQTSSVDDKRDSRLMYVKEASTLNEGQTVEYEEVPNKGKTSAENLKVV